MALNLSPLVNGVRLLAPDFQVFGNPRSGSSVYVSIFIGLDFGFHHLPVVTVSSCPAANATTSTYSLHRL